MERTVDTLSEIAARSSIIPVECLEKIVSECKVYGLLPKRASQEFYEGFYSTHNKAMERLEFLGPICYVSRMRDPYRVEYDLDRYVLMEGGPLQALFGESNVVDPRVELDSNYVITEHQLSPLFPRDRVYTIGTMVTNNKEMVDRYNRRSRGNWPFSSKTYLLDHPNPTLTEDACKVVKHWWDNYDKKVATEHANTFTTRYGFSVWPDSAFLLARID